MSLRARLLAAAAAVALVALAITGVATYSALRAFLYQQVDGGLESAAVSLQMAVDSGHGLNVPMVARLAPGMFVEIRGSSGTVLFTVNAQSPGGQSFTPALPTSFKVPPGHPGPGGNALLLTVPSAQRGGPAFRALAAGLAQGDALIVATPLQVTSATLHRLLLIELAVAAVGLLTAILLGWWLVVLGLTPLRQMEKTAGAIAAGQLSERVPEVQSGAELGRLARSFNVMLDRIEQAFSRRDATEMALRQSEERLRRFVADASHELRTPVTAVAAYAELFERGAHERPEDLARVLSGIRAETGRMARLVEDLLLLARLDEGRPLESGHVELVALAAAAVETARTVGPEWPVTLKAVRPVEVRGDATRLRQVLDNLLSNVRAHTPPGTATVVSVMEHEQKAVLTVADNGPGLSSDQIEHLFERFYRADPSRTRQRGGAGLGLAIVQAIVNAHGGQVTVASEPGQGTWFTVSLPALPQDDVDDELATGQSPKSPADIGPGKPLAGEDPDSHSE